MAARRRTAGTGRRGERARASMSDAITMRRPRIVLVALEYDAEPFSGNGILAQALVRGLSSIADVFVACARPVDDDDVDDDAVDDDDACVASTRRWSDALLAETRAEDGDGRGGETAFESLVRRTIMDLGGEETDPKRAMTRALIAMSLSKFTWVGIEKGVRAS